MSSTVLRETSHPRASFATLRYTRSAISTLFQLGVEHARIFLKASPSRFPMREHCVDERGFACSRAKTEDRSLCELVECLRLTAKLSVAAKLQGMGEGARGRGRGPRSSRRRAIRSAALGVRASTETRASRLARAGRSQPSAAAAHSWHRAEPVATHARRPAGMPACLHEPTEVSRRHAPRSNSSSASAHKQKPAVCSASGRVCGSAVVGLFRYAPALASTTSSRLPPLRR